MKEYEGGHPSGHQGFSPKTARRRNEGSINNQQASDPGGPDLKSQECIRLVPNRKLAIIHVRKTGGTSLRRELELSFPKATFFDAGPQLLERHGAGELDCYDIIFGHMFLDSLAKHRARRYTVIFLRDPIAQALSIWSFMRSLAGDPAMAKRADIAAACRYDFDAYVRTEDPNAYEHKRNEFAMILMGEKVKHCVLNETMARTIKTKLGEIDFVGLLEHYAEDSQMLLQILGAKPSTEPVWLNRTQGKIPDQSVSRATRDEILRKSSLDAEIYRLAMLMRRERAGEVHA